ncbi:MAG: hypothetical protein K9I36_11205 [Bacteroidia bacterium]|nr:hypothetical protein [Bacteroidia bacterium]MCF8427291.1 hypothetical protein [Bacteroidia bacterium]
MNPSPEQIPNEIFDWLQTKSYDQLNQNQQQELASFFTEQEYTLMHQIALQSKVLSNENVSRKARIKENLLLKLDQQQSKRKTPLILVKWQAWKVAASFILILGITVFLLKNSFRFEPNTNNLITKIDTVFIEKLVEVEPVKIYDTVYLTQNFRKENKGNRKVQNIEMKMDNRNQASTQTDLNIQSIEDIESLPNKSRSNSIKDDTLLKQYGFVSL